MNTPDYRKCLDQIKEYVPGKPIEDVKREYGIEEVIKIASNENPYPSPKAKEAVIKYLDEVNQYPNGACFEIREALAKHWNVKPGNLIFGNGGDEIIFYFAQTFLKENDEIIVPSCTFSEYITSAYVMGAKVKSVPVKDWIIDIDAIIDAINLNTKAIYITNPNNPTGHLLAKDKIDYLLEKMPENCLLFLDEAYFEFVTDQNYSNALKYVAEDKNVIVLRTFSKVYGLAGLRIGYGIAPERIINLVNKTRLPFNVNRLAQKAAIAALLDQENVNFVRDNNQKCKKLIYSEFDKLGLKYIPTEANFIWFEVNGSAAEVCEKLIRQGVIVRCGVQFGAPHHIRVSIGTMEETEMFIKALKNAL